MLKNILRELREQKGLSQAKMAEILGVSPAAYSTYEMGTRDVSSDKVVTLAKFYGVTTDYLYGIEDNSQSEISPDEQKHIKKYRALDSYGKKAIDDLLDTEYDRCINGSENNSNITVNEKTYSSRAVAFGGGNTETEITVDEMRQAEELIRKMKSKQNK